MTYQELANNIFNKRSFLCVGLDTDINLIPKHLLSAEDPIFEFNKQIVNATQRYTIAYKPNTAFYESMGSSGWKSLEKTAEYIKSNFPDIFLIADAKRGDIGNTSKMYAGAFLKNMPFDAITVAPYMGEDSVTPFLSYENKWVILLALTSNKGSADFQQQETGDLMLYEKVLKTSLQWGSKENLMYVAGATKAESFKQIRTIVPESFLLVPGIGAQGGSLNDVAANGMTSSCGLIVNSSREIIYAGDGLDFAMKSAEKAKHIQAEMDRLLDKFAVTH